MPRIPSLVILVWLLASPALAGAPFQFAAPGFRAPDDAEVDGVRFSVLHGTNERTSGLDLGLLSISETDRMSGVALIGGVHRVEVEVSTGVVFSIVNVHRGRDSGLNHAVLNLLENPDRALSVAFINLVEGESMAELGGINVSRTSGAQIGFVNVTREIRSFQFGFLNWAENGFLPVFPVVNFPAR